MLKIGSGIDFHKFALEAVAGHSIRLCGLDVPHPYPLIGHSDADVAIHALVDALLGASGLGDIGEHFPPQDNKWKNADSIIFLEYALKLLAEKQGRLINSDITIICESPKITPYKSAMRARLENIANGASFNIKATTTEGMGFLGRSEGIGALATALIEFPC